MSLIVLLLGALAVFSAEVHGCGCGQECYSTDTTYNYQYLLPAVPSRQARSLTVSFTVRASNDAFVSLAPDPDSHDLYEIVIGGWSNGKSVIRRCKQCQHKVEYNHSPLSLSEAREFVVTYENGRVAVATGSNPPFLVYNDPNPLDIGVIGFTTGWGSTGNFVFDIFDCY